MLLVLIRITAVIIGALFFLPAFPMAFLGFRENLWLLPIGALSGFVVRGSSVPDGTEDGRGNHKDESGAFTPHA